VEPLARHGWVLRGRAVESCHLITDALEAEPLHQFAERIGLRRAWFHDGSVPHYDLTASMRARAVACGAIEVDRYRLVELVQELRRRKREGNA
jgi:hypothetical protein